MNLVVSPSFKTLISEKGVRVEDLKFLGEFEGGGENEKRFIGVSNLGSSSGRFEEEAVSVVPELHAFSG